jgi:uncharacterized repeat protein (TIGR02543 family)
MYSALKRFASLMLALAIFWISPSYTIANNKVGIYGEQVYQMDTIRAPKVFSGDGIDTITKKHNIRVFDTIHIGKDIIPDTGSYGNIAEADVQAFADSSSRNSGFDLRATEGKVFFGGIRWWCVNKGRGTLTGSEPYSESGIGDVATGVGRVVDDNANCIYLYAAQPYLSLPYHSQKHVDTMIPNNCWIDDNCWIRRYLEDEGYDWLNWGAVSGDPYFATGNVIMARSKEYSGYTLTGVDWSNVADSGAKLYDVTDATNLYNDFFGIKRPAEAAALLPVTLKTKYVCNTNHYDSNCSALSQPCSGAYVFPNNLANKTNPGRIETIETKSVRFWLPSGAEVEASAVHNADEEYISLNPVHDVIYTGTDSKNYDSETRIKLNLYNPLKIDSRHFYYSELVGPFIRSFVPSRFNLALRASRMNRRICGYGAYCALPIFPGLRLDLGSIIFASPSSQDALASNVSISDVSEKMVFKPSLRSEYMADLVYDPATKLNNDDIGLMSDGMGAKNHIVLTLNDSSIPVPTVTKFIKNESSLSITLAEKVSPDYCVGAIVTDGVKVAMYLENQMHKSGTTYTIENSDFTENRSLKAKAIAYKDRFDAAYPIPIKSTGEPADFATRVGSVLDREDYGNLKDPVMAQGKYKIRYARASTEIVSSFKNSLNKDTTRPEFIIDSIPKKEKVIKRFRCIKKITDITSLVKRCLKWKKAPKKKSDSLVNRSKIHMDNTIHSFWSNPRDEETEYSLIYNENGGTSVPIDYNTYASGSSAIVLGQESMTRIGYKFLGWSMDSNAKTVQYEPGNSFIFPSSDVVLYAVWRNSYKVLYSKESGEGSVPIDPVSYIEGEFVTVQECPADLSFAGHIFSGWGFDGFTYTPNQKFCMPAKHVYFQAEWEAIANTYKVTYHLDDGTNQAWQYPNEYTSGTQITLKDQNTFTRDGYALIGWSLTPNGEMAYKAGSLFNVPSENVDLYAVWSKYYAVLYSTANGVGSVPPPEYYKESEIVTVRGPFNLKRDGFDFCGWTFEGTTYQEGEIFKMPKVNIMFLPKWKGKEHTIEYNANGGTGKGPIDSNIYSHDASVIVLGQMELEKNGCRFLGWATKQEATTPEFHKGDSIAFKTFKTSNIILYAVWSEYYTISYSDNGGIGQVPTSAQYSEGDFVRISGPLDLKRDGYDFCGWAFEGNAYQKNEIFKMPAKNVTFVANWKKKEKPFTYANKSEEGETPTDSGKHYESKIVTAAKYVSSSAAGTGAAVLLAKSKGVLHRLKVLFKTKKKRKWHLLFKKMKKRK